jgi:hypothetical protein
MTAKLVDQDMGPITREAAESALASGDPAEISMALLRLALHGPDWEFAEEVAREHAAHPDVWVRRNAATALGHVARVHRSLDSERSLPVLKGLMKDAEVTDWAEAALDDVAMYAAAERTSRVLAPALSSVSYDEKTQTLEVEFRNGGIYRYLEVSGDEVTRLLRADSLGQYLNCEIKPRFRVCKLRNPNESRAE